MANGGGRDPPVYERPSMRSFPIGYWPEGTRVVLIGSHIRADGRPWVRIRGPRQFEAWALGRFLSPVAPRDVVDQGFVRRVTYVAAEQWPGAIEVCANPLGGPEEISAGLLFYAIDRAAIFWSSAVPTAVNLSFTGQCASDPDDHADGQNSIGWGAPISPDGGALLGMTVHRARGGLFQEADVLISRDLLTGETACTPAKRRRKAWNCMADVLVHELGHVVGLTHAPDVSDSVMRTGIACERTSRLPDIDLRNLLLLAGP